MTDLAPITILTIEMPVVIRVLEAADLPRLEWYGEFTHFRNLFRRSYREQQLGNRLLLVADSRGYPIGRLFIQFRSENHRIADGLNRGYLYSFHVMEAFRGLGIGSRLLDEGERILHEHGFTIATIAVAKDNHRAIRLYRRRGYTVFDESPGKWRYLDHRGNVRDVHEPSWLMQKFLVGD